MSLDAEQVAFSGCTHDDNNLALALAFDGWGSPSVYVDVRIWWQA